MGSSPGDQPRWYLLRRRGSSKTGAAKAVMVQATTEARARVAVASLIREESVGENAHWDCTRMQTQYVVIYEGGSGL